MEKPAFIETMETALLRTSTQGCLKSFAPVGCGEISTMTAAWTFFCAEPRNPIKSPVSIEIMETRHSPILEPDCPALPSDRWHGATTTMTDCWIFSWQGTPTILRP